MILTLAAARNASLTAIPGLEMTPRIVIRPQDVIATAAAAKEVARTARAEAATVR